MKRSWEEIKALKHLNSIIVHVRVFTLKAPTGKTSGLKWRVQTNMISRNFTHTKRTNKSQSLNGKPLAFL